jgi:hypothetical protein
MHSDSNNWSLLKRWKTVSEKSLFQSLDTFCYYYLIHHFVDLFCCLFEKFDLSCITWFISAVKNGQSFILNPCNKLIDLVPEEELVLLWIMILNSDLTKVCSLNYNHLISKLFKVLNPNTGLQSFFKLHNPNTCFTPKFWRI